MKSTKQHKIEKQTFYFKHMQNTYRMSTNMQKGRLKRTLWKPVEEESETVGLRKEEALCQSKWSACINQIAAGLR